MEHSQAVEELLLLDILPPEASPMYDGENGTVLLKLRELTLEELRAEIVYKLQAFILFEGRPIEVGDVSSFLAATLALGALDLSVGGFIVRSGTPFDGGCHPVYASHLAPEGIAILVPHKDCFGLIAQDFSNPLLRAVYIHNLKSIRYVPVEVSASLAATAF